MASSGHEDLPMVLGLLYLPGTRFPCHKKFGCSSVLVNKINCTVASIDEDGCTTLEEGGDYIPEQSDGEHLRKVSFSPCWK
jgi:hypothetical protein